MKESDIMDNEKGEGGGDTDGTKKKLSEDGAEALQKCLEENKGDRSKCKSRIDALRSSSAPRKRRVLPLRLKSGSLTDV
ncbi:hypothetical protein OIU85_020646 [Salix viminalis]|uniref:Uncharacterized protein n=1 Tax=Salix viminalis TaxID=40686 RepID=A0A9Q0UGZ7_SALVM|nr:hypothetical protein OIU85_020646 [Salix viminalis]